MGPVKIANFLREDLYAPFLSHFNKYKTYKHFSIRKVSQAKRLSLHSSDHQLFNRYSLLNT